MNRKDLQKYLVAAKLKGERVFIRSIKLEDNKNVQYRSVYEVHSAPPRLSVKATMVYPPSAIVRNIAMPQCKLDRMAFLVSKKSTFNDSDKRKSWLEDTCLIKTMIDYYYESNE